MLIVSRCASAERAFGILRDDFLDAPVRYFSDGLRHRLARSWTSSPPKDIALLVAEIDGVYAGFTLAQMRGRAFWRSVVREHPTAFPSFLRALLRTRLANGGDGSRPAGRPVEVPAMDTDFAWSATPTLGVIEFVFVSPEFRGRAVAPALLRAAAEAAQAVGAPFMEAHIDQGNYSSVRAFCAAGWDVWRMRGGDYLARTGLTAGAAVGETGS